MLARILFMDCETNGLYADECSVLSVSAIKVLFEVHTQKILEEISRFERFYYLPKNEKINWRAIDVNGLTPEVLDEKRKNVSYSKTFKKDSDWRKYISDVDLFVSHNIEFDSSFLIPKKILNDKKKKFFCTMESNIYEIKIEFDYCSPYGDYKYPSLFETANYYNIDIDRKRLHESSYDCELVMKIFEKMLEKGVIKTISSYSSKYIIF